MVGGLQRWVDAIGSIPERRGATIGLLVVACIIAYAAQPLNGFVLDDHQIVLGNPVVTEVGRALEAFTTPYQGAERRDLLYRPLTVVSLAAQWAIHGDAPGMFHVVNVLLHIAATLLSWAFAQALLPGRGMAALLAGLIFAVHPIHTDAVCSVVNRSEVLAAAFAMAGFLSWRRWMQGARGEWLAVAGMAFLAAVLSKESGAPLPAFAAAWAIPMAHRSRRPAVIVAGWVAAFLLPAGAYLVLRANALDGALVASANRYFASVGTWQTLLTMAGIGARYLALLVVPYPLSPDYSFESVPLAGSPFEPWPLAGLVLVPAALAGTALLLSGRSVEARGAGFGLLWFGLFMAPTANIVPIMIPMAERFTYIGSAGAFAAAGAALSRLPGRGRGLGGLALAILLAGLVSMTAARVRTWRDDLTLAADAVITYPHNAIMLANLGAALAYEGQAGPAVEALRRALVIAPAKWEFRVTLARLLHDSGLHRDEADLLLAGLAFGPRSDDELGLVCDAVAEAEPGIGRQTCLRRLPAR